MPSASEDNPPTTDTSARQVESRGRRSSACDAHPLPTTLREAIEAEREHLLQVQAMARCLYEVLLYSDDDDGAMHADVAQVIVRLVRENGQPSGANRNDVWKERCLRHRGALSRQRTE